MKVFLVEDSPLLRTRLEAMISSIPGAQAVAHADSADEAIRQILTVRPDAVVLDIHLKQGNGFDILRAVARAAPEIAFYVLTNYPLESYRQRADRQAKAQAVEIDKARSSHGAGLRGYGRTG